MALGNGVPPNGNKCEELETEICLDAVFVNINELKLGVQPCDPAKLQARVHYKIICLNLLFVQRHDTVYPVKVIRQYQNSSINFYT